MDEELIPWDEYKKSETIKPRYIFTHIACPKCGQALRKDVSIVLTSNPPKYQYVCVHCEWSGYR